MALRTSQDERNLEGHHETGNEGHRAVAGDPDVEGSPNAATETRPGSRAAPRENSPIPDILSTAPTIVGNVSVDHEHFVDSAMSSGSQRGAYSRSPLDDGLTKEQRREAHRGAGSPRAGSSASPGSPFHSPPSHSNSLHSMQVVSQPIKPLARETSNTSFGSGRQSSPHRTSNVRSPPTHQINLTLGTNRGQEIHSLSPAQSPRHSDAPLTQAEGFEGMDARNRELKEKWARERVLRQQQHEERLRQQAAERERQINLKRGASAGRDGRTPSEVRLPGIHYADDDANQANSPPPAQLKDEGPPHIHPAHVVIGGGPSGDLRATSAVGGKRVGTPGVISTQQHIQQRNSSASPPPPQPKKTVLDEPLRFQGNTFQVQHSRAQQEQQAQQDRLKEQLAQLRQLQQKALGQAGQVPERVPSRQQQRPTSTIGYGASFSGGLLVSSLNTSGGGAPRPTPSATATRVPSRGVQGNPPPQLQQEGRTSGTVASIVKAVTRRQS